MLEFGTNDHARSGERGQDHSGRRWALHVGLWRLFPVAFTNVAGSKLVLATVEDRPIKR